jgi:glycosyltransferase involved in cell wall biosynthesis
MKSGKIAFIKAGSFSKINASVVKVIKDWFPEFEVDEIDIYDLLLNNKQILLFNLFFAIKDFGVKIFFDRKRFIWYFFSTSFIFYKVKTLVSNYISQDRDSYVFSFQTQAFTDASQIGLPNFLYTDNTVLANSYYRDFDQSNILPEWRIALERQTYQNATINFVMSTNVQRSMIEQYSCKQEQVACVCVGSNVEISDEQNGQRNYQSKNILFVGIDWERKGGPTLVEAFKLVAKEHPDARLTVVGCSPDLNIPNCTVVGRVQLEKVHKYYLDAAIFCLPTTFEPFGIVFVEALSYKLPVIGTNIGAIPDFIRDGENGYLISPGDVQQLSKVLISLLNEPNKCKAFGENGYNIALEYSWEKVGSRMRKSIIPFIHKPIEDER